MILDRRSCYEALRAKDYRYDGRFFVAVKTTGIYCRPICPAKAARFENVTFFRTASEAEEDGFRPCKRCRPEAAAGSPLWNGTSTTVSRALKLIDEGYLDRRRVGDLAETLGLGERHLRSLFDRHVGVSPKTLADSKRLDFARNLIDSTRLPMTEIAHSAGFASIRRFNDAVKRRYRIPPRELRESATAPPGLVFHVAYRPPYDWSWMLDYLRRRAVAGVERVDGDTYARSFRLREAAGWFRLVPEPVRHRARVEVILPSARGLMRVNRRVRRLFDLDADPLRITGALSRDPTLGPLVRRFPGTRLPGSWDGFEATVRAIAGQLVSLGAGATFAARLVEAHGEVLPGDEPGAPTRLFPTPAALVEADLSTLGLTRAKSRAIRELARRTLDGEIAFEGIVDFARLRERLLAIPGVGPWTADYVSLKLSDPDGFPRSDLVIAKCLERLECDGAAWAPWRGYATHYLWRWYAEDRERDR